MWQALPSASALSALRVENGSISPILRRFHVSVSVGSPNDWYYDRGARGIVVDGWYAAAAVAVLLMTTTVSRRSKRIRRSKILGRFLFGTAVVSTNVESNLGFMDERVVHFAWFYYSGFSIVISELGTLEQLRVDAQSIAFGRFSVAEEFSRA